MKVFIVFFYDEDLNQKALKVFSSHEDALIFAVSESRDTYSVYDEVSDEAVFDREGTSSAELVVREFPVF